MAGMKTTNLALQGGGAHGAFAWGVLDKLLEDGRVGIEGISATSAGAMNAAVLAYGLCEGGPEGARTALESFWRRIADAGGSGHLAPSFGSRALQEHHYNVGFLFFDMLTRLFSPYQLNPFNINPLGRVLEAAIDFDKLRRSSSVKLFLSATNVRSGKIKIFKNAELTCSAVLASACLPFLFQAVEMNGEAYWDGGYLGNPAIFPLIYECTSPDILVVHINPLTRPDIPKTATEILNRMNEISFNSSLIREMRAISFITRLIEEGKIVDGALKRVFVHSIIADDFMQGLGVNSKINTDWGFLTHLRDVGREKTAEWLGANFAELNERSTADLGSYL
jgi:NTE family protein